MYPMSKENNTYTHQIMDTQEKIDFKFKALIDSSPAPSLFIIVREKQLT